jgi:tetratricopeptide (TPR) repeat protein
MERRREWHFIARAALALACFVGPFGLKTIQHPPSGHQDTYTVTTLPSTGEPMTDHQAARQHAFRGDYVKAREAYLRAIDHASPSAIPQLWLDLAWLATAHGQRLQARYAFEQAIVTGADNPQIQAVADQGLHQLTRPQRTGQPDDSFLKLLEELDQQSQVQPDREGEHQPGRTHVRQQRALKRCVGRVVPPGTPSEH